MKAWWVIQEARINGLSLRERLFLFVSVLVVMLAVADVLWLSPAQADYKQIQQRFTVQSAEVGRLRAELASVSKPVDASADLRASVEQLQARMASLRAEIAASAPGAASGTEALEQVLVQFLKRRPGLRLVSSGTVANEAGAADAAHVPGVQRRGLELKVAGPYPELTRYVQSLEQALPHLRWGTMQLAVDTQGPELTLLVYVLEVAP
jgi:MSHA biogenesis protein MshJ